MVNSFTLLEKYSQLNDMQIHLHIKKINLRGYLQIFVLEKPMKRLLMIILTTISPILAQCDWNDDGTVDVLDVVSMVDCILTNCWNGSQCDWNGDGDLNVIDVVDTIDCILFDCFSVDVYGCTDPEAINYNPDANIDDGGCDYADDTCIDIDGNIYDTIQLGDQLWMAENLKVTHYRNGEEIPTGFNDSGWINLNDTETGAYAVYNDDPVNAETYGNLYNWYAVDDSRGVCPEDFHIPTDEEWMELEMYMGMSYEEAHDSDNRGTDQGSQLAGNADLWFSGSLENDPAFGSSGFTALPGGYRSYGNGYYIFVGEIGWFWSSTAYNNNRAWHRVLSYDNSDVNRSSIFKRSGSSVRCVGD